MFFTTIKIIDKGSTCIGCEIFIYDSIDPWWCQHTSLLQVQTVTHHQTNSAVIVTHALWCNQWCWLTIKNNFSACFTRAPITPLHGSQSTIHLFSTHNCYYSNMISSVIHKTLVCHKHFWGWQLKTLTHFIFNFKYSDTHCAYPFPIDNAIATVSNKANQGCLKILLTPFFELMNRLGFLAILLDDTMCLFASNSAIPSCKLYLSWSTGNPSW